MTDKELRKFGIVGLGKMGGGIAGQALRKGFSVVGFDKAGVAPDLAQQGLLELRTLEAFKDVLERPRIVVVYVPAGPVVDHILQKLATVLEAGDLIADGGNSYWGDSVRRHARLADQGIDFVDVGTSGGPKGAANGACFMVGGDAAPVTRLEPILRKLATDGGYVHAGGPGAGHFVKLVHNGIEFGMLQAIAEGVGLLEGYRQSLPIANVLNCWRHGSVIRSWLIELMETAYRENGGLSKVPAYVEDTGEVNWLVADALQMEVPIPIITQSVVQLIASRDDRRNWARAIAMMRHAFGEHPYGADPHIAQERHTGRVGGFINAEKPSCDD
jgi:6-phosphogluconate dehydrogenase